MSFIAEADIMKVPGPDHPITVTRSGKHVRVTFAGRVVADTKNALTLNEANYRPALYVPRADTDMSVLAPSDHHTHCPYKGDATYFTINVNGSSAENAVWSYAEPYPAMAEIKEYLAFYPDRVDKIEEV